MSLYALAVYRTALGENDKALDALEQAYELRQPPLYLLKIEPRFDPLRGDPRFHTLLRKVGFPQQSMVSVR